MFVISGAANLLWGIAFGVLMATLSAIFWLFALPVLPIWSLVIILIDVLIVYGLVAHAESAQR